MTAAPLPIDEDARLAALEATGLLDSPPSDLLDGFVRVARELFDAPIAAIALIEADRQFFKAMSGLAIHETARDLSFCAHAILKPTEVMCIPDATADPRFADNALVTGDPHIRFYAGAPITDAEGTPLGALCVIDRHPQHPTPATLARLRDVAAGVSAAVQLHAMTRQKAVRPPGTLPGRLPLEAALVDAARPAAPEGATLLLIDLDNVKGINDVFGHRGGDLVVAEVAARLRGLEGAAAYRLHGDEFALLATLPTREARDALAARVHATLARPFAIDSQAVAIRASLGVATLSNAPGNPEDRAETLFRAADSALSAAKRAGRDCTCHAPTPAHGPPTASPTPPAIGRIDLGRRLRRALVPSGNEPFTLAFQPVVSLAECRTTCLEALVRWNPPGTAPVSPGEFVTLAERIGLVSHLDRWVLSTACRTAAAWPHPWGVCVNISAISFGLIDVPALVVDALAATSLPAHRLTIEMTETALASEPERARRAVTALRALGVGVALDDFGAGHGSLTTLRSFPFTELKIDRGLIDGIATDPAQAHMVGLVTQLGNHLGILVVAEGVETRQELATVTALGATHVQGRLLSWPVPAADVPKAGTEAGTEAAEAFAAAV